MHRPETAQLPLPVIGFVGWSGSGKTTLITALLPLLMQRGRRVAVLKHAHHGFDIDRPGKDSYRVREAGAAQVLVASRNRWVLMTEERGRDPVHGHEADIVPVRRVSGSGVSEANEKAHGSPRSGEERVVGPG